MMESKNKGELLMTFKGYSILVKYDGESIEGILKKISCISRVFGVIFNYKEIYNTIIDNELSYNQAIDIINEVIMKIDYNYI